MPLTNPVVIKISAGTTSNTASQFTFADSNGVSFGINNSTITASVAQQSQSNQSVGFYAVGNTTQNSSTTLDARSISFDGLGIASVGFSNGSIQVSVQANTDAQTNQTIGYYAVGNTTQNSSTTLDARTVSINGLGIITVGYSNGSIDISATQSNQTAGFYAVGNTTQSSSTTIDARSISFDGLGIASVGFSNGSVQVSVPAPPPQTNQTAGLYAVGNTTQNSSTTLDARTISFDGLGIASVGFSNGSVQISVPAPAAQTNQSVGLYAVGNTTQNSSTTLDARTISFDGLGVASVGFSNGSVQISVPAAAAQTNQTIGYYAVGNTTQNSSTTLDARTVSYDGLGIVTVGFSNGSIQVSATQSAQTVGLYAVGNTTQNSSTTLDARTLSFDGLGAASVGFSNGSVQISVPNTVAQTNQSVGFYAVGNTTQNSSTTLDARTISFDGLGAATVGFSNGSVQISAPVQTNQTVGLYAVSNTTGASTSTTADARSISFQGAGIASVGYTNGSVVVSVPSGGGQTNQTVGFYAVGNTTQNSSTTLDARTVSFNGLGIVTVGYSNGSVDISATQSAQTAGFYAVGNTTQNSSTTLDMRTVSFDGLGEVTVGYSNGSIQISAPVQTNQSVGFYAVSNTTGASSSTTVDARSVSFQGAGAASVGYTNGSVVISVANGAQSNQTMGLYAIGNTTGNTNTTTIDARTLGFSGLLAASVGFSDGYVQIASPIQTNQSMGFYAVGNTTQNSSTTLDARTVSFDGLGAATVGYSNGSIQISVPVQTNQSIGYYAVGNTTQNSSTTLDARTVSYDGLGIVTVGFSNGSIQISATQSAQTVGLYAVGNTTQNSSTTLDARTISYDGLGIASVGFSNGSVQISVPSPAAQTNQTIGYYAVGNTTQNSSTTLDARTVSFDGLGAATVGFSNGSIQISAPVQTNQTLELYAVDNTTGQSSSTTVDARTVSFDGRGIASVGYSAGSVIVSVPSPPVQTNQTVGFYAVGNTTQNSSTTLDARTISFDGLGAATVGFSNGSVQVSVPTRQVSQLLWPDDPWQTHFAISNASFSLQHFNPKADITASQVNLLAAMAGNSGSSGALTISLGIYTMAGSTMSLASSDSRQISWTSGSDSTASSLYGGVSGTRYRTISLANWSITAGDYMLGAWFRTTNDGAWRAFGREGPTIIDALDSNETNHYHHGYSVSSYSTAMVASVNVTNTNYVRTGGDALKQPSIIFLGSY